MKYLDQLCCQSLFFFSVLFGILFCPQRSVAQYNDCISPYPFCASTNSITVSTVVQGWGFVNELINDSVSCLQNNENNSTWVTFQVDTAALLTFDITPLGMVDYDFALYDLTNSSCQDIFNVGNLPVRCNYAFGQGVTGLRPGFADSISDSSGDQFVSPLAVDSGQVFTLLIDGFTRGNTGFTLNVTSGIELLPVFITRLQNARVLLRCDSTLNISFGNEIDCSSLSDDFSELSIINSNVSIIGVECAPNEANVLTLILDKPIMEDSLTIVVQNGSDGNTLLDGCGETFLDSGSVVLDLGALLYTPIVPDFNSFTFGNDPLLRRFVNGSSNSDEFFWQVGDGATYSSNSVNHRYSQYGDYQVCLQVSNECYTAEICSTIGVFPVGIEGITARPSIIFGSETKQLFIKDYSTPKLNPQVHIYNMMGQLIRTEFIVGPEVMVGLAQLNSGLYLAVLELENRHYTKKIIIH